ncbi:MAG: ATP-binding protein [Peptococcaceae bacterium]|jgi:predicted AAA+ superfamily ATPase|nr:ATP-binding protein [Peptococcaceae bacterium]
MLANETGKTALLAKALGEAGNLLLYRGILEDPVCRAMLRFLRAVRGKSESEAFAELFFLLSRHAGPGDAWQNHLLDLVLYDDNAFTREAAAGADRMSESLKAAARTDLRILHNLFRVDASVVRESLGSEHLWRDLGSGRAAGQTAIRTVLSGARDWSDCLEQLAAYHQEAGAGLFARYHAFRWRDRLEGIETPDPVALDDLVGYRSQRRIVVANTERFLAGLPANNILLYGDRGTGKSSTVKALLNRYRDRGLRMVEVAKADLADFPRIVRQLRGSSLCFILFVDDLSFEEDEVEYKELKAVLEGGLEARPVNVLIYATSNRRHLVRERFSDRQPEYGDNGEVRTGDTVQEKLSLADRFGITVLFTAPDKALYLDIVRGLARRGGVTLPDDELTRRALVWEVWQNGRSGRTARQFVDQISGDGEWQDFPAVRDGTDSGQG